MGCGLPTERSRGFSRRASCFGSSFLVFVSCGLPTERSRGFLTAGFKVFLFLLWVSHRGVAWVSHGGLLFLFAVGFPQRGRVGFSRRASNNFLRPFRYKEIALQKINYLLQQCHCNHFGLGSSVACVVTDVVMRSAVVIAAALTLRWT